MRRVAVPTGRNGDIPCKPSPRQIVHASENEVAYSDIGISELRGVSGRLPARRRIAVAISHAADVSRVEYRNPRRIVRQRISKPVAVVVKVGIEPAKIDIRGFRNLVVRAAGQAPSRPEILIFANVHSVFPAYLLSS